MPQWSLRTAASDDVEPIAELRSVVLRADLERLGRYDEHRVRQRLRDGFDPTCTRIIEVDGAFAGCIAMRSAGDGDWLEHFYLDPHLQGRGIGTEVLVHELTGADREGRVVRLNVLQGSAARRLYERHGFAVDAEDPIDVFMVRTPVEPTTPSQTHDLQFTESEVHKRFLSWSDGEADREWACLDLIWEHAPGLAPRPLRREIVDGHPVVVMQRLPGKPLGNGPLSPEQLASLGRTLRRLYGIPREHATAAGIGERRYGPSILPLALSEWLSEAHDYSPCEDAARVAEAVGAARRWLSHPGSLPTPRLDALGIADLNPANILWDGQRCRLVDFEDGGLTDPAYELADHVEHIAGRPTGVFNADDLASAVGLDEEQRGRMRAYRPLWAAFWLAMLLPGSNGFRRNPPGTTEAQASHLLHLID
ncbi:GNAT family N-acetyltransferase [Microbacterium karelineae]|uniref:GNAT family N-acetyltransferase n=1 Tax=Microbacterium karelineae TaxID=2654283 RepID=UPI0012EA1EA6|nr:GNAT family N-acetyltransferase [Microbacterium karelineae]